VLTLWRRHNPARCKLRSRFHNRCSCPIWVGGSLPGTGDQRKALKTRDWREAQKIIREWEIRQQQPRLANNITLEQWRIEFLQDTTSRHLAPDTIRKYKHLFRQLEAFAKTKRLLLITDLDTAMLGAFRAGWKDGALSAAKKLERLRSIFRFAVQRDWIKTNPARELKMPRPKPNPTLPFSTEEMDRIIKAAESDARLLAFVYVMRYGGLRISDTTTLAVSSLQGGLLHLQTEKTGETVRVPLPKYVVDALRAIPHTNPNYFFWTGTSKVQAAASVWRKRLATLFTAAKVHNGHSHRFRDTFAVGLLEGGVSIENVAKLLGHESIRVTEKHYAPWVKTRQQILEREIMKVYEIGIDLD
jgi:integrase/recombinase XerD